jgi:hypothetical protein
VEKLEAELEKHRKEVSTLKSDRDKTVHILAELQVAISDKTKLLSEANDSIADLKLKLTTLEESLNGSRAREKTLDKDLKNEKLLLESTAATHNDYVEGVSLWTSCLIDAMEGLTTQLSVMGIPNFRFSHDRGISGSARLTMFFEAVNEALKLLHSNRVTQLASKSCKLCQGVLLKVLTKVVYRNPGLDLSQDSLLADADCRALEERVAPILSMVDQVKRVEGQRRD